MSDGGTHWQGEASEGTLRRLVAALEGLVPSGPGGGPALTDQTINVQEYVRPDGTTSRVVEQRVVGGTVIQTTTTNYAVVVDEDEA